MSPFEIGMMVCFGVSWPLSILKLWQTKRSDGKSLTFGSIVLLAYVFGVLHKWYYNYDLVILLYMFNMLMIMIDIMLTIKYRNKINS
ncbi:MAG: hypothetical protein LBE12_04655 [Planctomycetaceae bacterium]|jgi:hypothetical protein|nr:hypothetical protein [Planctomycetaceae bacterium]